MYKNFKYLLVIVIYCIIYCFPSEANANKWFLEDEWSLEQYHKFQNRYQDLLSNKIEYRLLADTNKRPYDVISYDIDLDWYDMLLSDSTMPEKRFWKGKNDIKLVITEDDVDGVEFDAIGLEINKVYLNDVLLEETPQAADNVVFIPFNAPAKTNDEVRILIEYTYKNTENIGFNLYYKDAVIHKTNNYKIEEQIAYTVNSPNYARYWLPCNDRTRDKAIVSVSVTVPPEFSAASNGLLDTIINMNYEDGTVKQVFKWSDNVPIATYLINATASIYTIFYEKFKSPNIPDSIDMVYYVWKADYEGQGDFNAKRKLETSAASLEYFSKLYIDYPFCKYGQAVVYPFIYGAMENQTMTTLNRLLMLKTYQADITIAHEISHQWFGDLVTAFSWDDIWFKEGAATWSEALWTLEKTQDSAKYYKYMQNEAAGYKELTKMYSTPIHGNSPDLMFTSDYVPLTYNKASWIYHQLKILLGDDVIFPILRELLEEYRFKNIDARLFIDFFKEKTKDMELEVSLDTFFDQWLFKAGHPYYDINTQYKVVTDSTMDASVTVSQIQDAENVVNVFETPIYLMFYNNNQLVHSQRVLNNQRVQEYKIENIPNFTRVNIDISKTLCENKSMKTTSIKGDKNDIQLYPNPAIQSDYVYISNINNPFNNIKIYNAIGNVVDVEIGNFDNVSSINISNLESGLYYAVVNNRVFKFSVIK